MTPERSGKKGGARSRDVSGRRRRILLLHGPNLNRLGARDPEIYGTVTLAEIVEAVTTRARMHGMEVVAFQSNHEGALIDWLQAKAPRAEGIIVNPGGLAHYSVALRDALEDAKAHVIEVHISNPLTREPFRRPLVTATAAETCIVGKGLKGYLDALDLLLEGRVGRDEPPGRSR